MTRVTKVTTTRSVRQVPVQSPYSNIDFDSSGLPTPSPVIDRDPSLEMMARMGGASDHDSEDRSAPPPAPASRFLHEGENYVLDWFFFSLFFSTLVSKSYDKF